MPQRSGSDEVRVACTDHVHRALRRSALIGIPASALLAVLLGPTVPLDRRIAFVAFVSLADIVTFATSHVYLVRRRRREDTPHRWIGPSAVAMIGLAWGSAALFALPGARHIELRAVLLLFACGVSATYVVGAAARRLYYFASQVPMLAAVFVGFMASGDHVTRLLSIAIPIYFIVMTAMHQEVHAVVLSELQLRVQNDKNTRALRQANARLTTRALHDELTGLVNRATFLEYLDEAVGDARSDGTIVGVIYLDLDRFKVVNDSLGHGGGDELLANVASRLQAVTRGTDVVARIGGDEFTMLLRTLRTAEQAVAVAHRVAAALDAPFEVCGRRLSVTASIGVTTNRHSADDGEALLSHADAAQYRAKELGRARVEVFDNGLRETIERRLEKQEELRDAIASGAIVPWYQPEIDMATGEIIGAEALARWLHPARGVLAAGTFIETAEQAALTPMLDRRIITGAVRTRARLRDAGLVGSDFRVWFNVSHDQLTRSNPADRLARLLDRTSCEPNLIGIEITETAVLSDIDAVAHELDVIRSSGVKVALDDFGTGHSSLTLLRSLPIDRVKIDRSFIRDVTTDERDAAIVRHLVALAHDLSLDLVAEGVETPEQVGRLRELGCRHAQGFLWSKAVPVEELTALVAAQQTAGDQERRVLRVPA